MEGAEPVAGSVPSYLPEEDEERRIGETELFVRREGIRKEYHLVELKTRIAKREFPRYIWPQMFFSQMETVCIGWHNWGRFEAPERYSLAQVEHKYGGRPRGTLAMLHALLQRIAQFVCQQGHEGPTKRKRTRSQREGTRSQGVGSSEQRETRSQREGTRSQGVGSSEQREMRSQREGTRSQGVGSSEQRERTRSQREGASLQGVGSCEQMDTRSQRGGTSNQSEGSFKQGEGCRYALVFIAGEQGLTVYKRNGGSEAACDALKEELISPAPADIADMPPNKRAKKLSTSSSVRSSVRDIRGPYREKKK